MREEDEDEGEVSQIRNERGSVKGEQGTEVKDKIMR